MVKFKKSICLLLVTVLIAGLFIMFLPVVSAEIDIGFPSDGEGKEIEEVKTMVDNIWGTTLVILQIVAFMGILFCGLRYMFASADRRADIKNGLIGIAAGCILVFASSTVVKFVIKTTEEATGTNKKSNIVQVEEFISASVENDM